MARGVRQRIEKESSHGDNAAMEALESGTKCVTGRLFLKFASLGFEPSKFPRLSTHDALIDECKLMEEARSNDFQGPR